MRKISSSRWKRRGSSVLFDQQALGSLLAAGCLVSLREALSWLNEWPDAPPGNGETLLVSGLEPCLELFSPSEAEEFLRLRVRPLIEEFQSYWDQRGLVFGFGKPEKSFQIRAMSEELLYIRQDRTPIRLAVALWNGGSAMNVARLVRQETPSQTITIGYHVPRIS